MAWAGIVSALTGGGGSGAGAGGDGGAGGGGAGGSSSGGGGSSSGPRESLEVVLILDTTGSMSSSISAMQEVLDGLLRDLSGRYELRTTFIDCKDYDCNPSAVFGPTSDVSTVRAAVSRCRASGGADGPEAYRTSLHDVLNLPLDPSTRTIVVVIADCWPHFQKDPSSSQWSKEDKALSARKETYHKNWFDLCVALADAGLQVFSLLPTGTLSASYLPYVQLAECTGGLSLHVKDRSAGPIGQCLLALIEAMIKEGGAAADVALPSSVALWARSPEAMAEGDLPEDDDSMVALFRGGSDKHGAVSSSDKTAIAEGLERSRSYFRLRPEDRGFKRARAFMSSNELVEIAPSLVRALAEAHRVLTADDEAAVAALDAAALRGDADGEHVETASARMERELGRIRPLKAAAAAAAGGAEGLTDEVSLGTQAEALAELAEAFGSGELMKEAEAAEDAVAFWVGTLGKLFFGHPFLIELAAKFNFQDAWAAPVRRVYPQVISLPTLQSMLAAAGDPDDEMDDAALEKMASKTGASLPTCRSLFRDGRVSGIVGLSLEGDVLGNAVSRLLLASGWGNSLTAYAAHGHLEPLPWMYHGILGACHAEYIFANVRAADDPVAVAAGAGSEAHTRCLSDVVSTLRVLPRAGGDAMAALDRFVAEGPADAAAAAAAEGGKSEDAAEAGAAATAVAHAAEALSPRDPFNVGSMSRTAVLVSQLPAAALKGAPDAVRSELARAVMGEMAAFWSAVVLPGEAGARTQWVLRALPAKDLPDPASHKETEAHPLDALDEEAGAAALAPSAEVTDLASRLRAAVLKWMEVAQPALVEEARALAGGDKAMLGALVEAALLGGRAARYSEAGAFAATGFAADEAAAERLAARIQFNALKSHHAAGLTQLRARREAAARALAVEAAAAAFAGGVDALRTALNTTQTVRGVAHDPDAEDTSPILAAVAGVPGAGAAAGAAAAGAAAAEGDAAALQRVRESLLLLTTRKVDPSKEGAEPEWGDDRRFGDMDVLEAALKVLMPGAGTAAEELIELVTANIARELPNRHGSSARLPVQKEWDALYARRRIGNRIAPGLLSHICGGCRKELPSHGPHPTVPARCRGCKREGDVRLSIRGAEPHKGKRDAAVNQLRRLAVAAGLKAEIVDEMYDDVLAYVNRED